MALQTPKTAQGLSEKAEQKLYGEKPQSFGQDKTMAKGEVTWQIVKYEADRKALRYASHHD